jgi:hypothetical protein
VFLNDNEFTGDIPDGLGDMRDLRKWRTKPRAFMFVSNCHFGGIVTDTILVFLFLHR